MTSISYELPSSFFLCKVRKVSYLLTANFVISIICTYQMSMLEGGTGAREYESLYQVTIRMMTQ